MTDDVTAAGAGALGGSFDLSDVYHVRHYNADGEVGVMLGDHQCAAMLDHEFSPPSPAPQDALSYTPRSAPFNR